MVCSLRRCRSLGGVRGREGRLGRLGRPGWLACDDDGRWAGSDGWEENDGGPPPPAGGAWLSSGCEEKWLKEAGPAAAAEEAGRVGREGRCG